MAWKPYSEWRRQYQAAGNDIDKENLMRARYPTLIASPQLAFSELCKRLSEFGWKLESASENPLIAEEPELALFVQPQDETTIHYTFNPVVQFRVLQFRGSNAESQYDAVASRIPILRVKELRTLLDSREIRQILLGLLAAEELSEIGVVDQVARLCTHQDARIVRTAVRIRESLVPSMLDWAIGQLTAESARHPERSVWFSHLPQAELRKQVLRWLMRDFTTSSGSIDQALRSALSDPDPEVRIAAVIAAAKLNAKNTGPELRAAAIPTSTSEGADSRDRFFFERLRQAALRYLATEPPGSDDRNENRREQFRKAICGELEVRDDPTLLLHALITPLEPVGGPVQLPKGVERRDEGYFLRRSQLSLCWIAAVPHWLGEDAASSPSARNPIRQAKPKNGFFITEAPISSAVALWSTDPATEPSHSDNGGSPFLCTYEVAAHLCEVFSALEGVRLHLPSADQWEMAARGPDGRRYPWGNCLSPGGQLLTSPWGMKREAGGVFEWTSDVNAEGNRIVCGGNITASCAARSVAPALDASVQCGVRLIVEGVTG